MSSRRRILTTVETCIFLVKMIGAFKACEIVEQQFSSIKDNCIVDLQSNTRVKLPTKSNNPRALGHILKVAARRHSISNYLLSMPVYFKISLGTGAWCSSYLNFFCIRTFVSQTLKLSRPFDPSSVELISDDFRISKVRKLRTNSE